MRRTLLMLAMVGTALILAAPPAAAGVTTQTADVVGQGPAGPAVGIATLQRSANGISVKVNMPTPEPGSYLYPGGNAFQPEGALFVEGRPEAFSLWVFVFNHPHLCSEPCNADDLGDTPAQGGAFNAAGHLVGGPNLQLSGRVTVNSAPFVGAMLTEPETAEVHLAVAPHGALQPDVLPDQIKKPIGTPDFWWLALFH